VGPWRRTRLGPGAPCSSRVSLHRYVPGRRINLDHFQHCRARREVEIQAADLSLLLEHFVAEGFHLISRLTV
jgi:hypothetical protein